MKDYLMNVLVHLRLTKALSSTPTPQDVAELQDCDWLIEDTEELLENEWRKEDGSNGTFRPGAE